MSGTLNCQIHDISEPSKISNIAMAIKYSDFEKLER